MGGSDVLVFLLLFGVALLVGTVSALVYAIDAYRERQRRLFPPDRPSDN